MFNFIKKFKNAAVVVKQLRNDEWSIKGHVSTSGQWRAYTAQKGDHEMWLANGGWFCEVDYCAFGLLWRHYVWFAAARKLVAEAEAKQREAFVIPTLF